ncbi:MAG: ISKra4 family transposase [Acidimicrobiales bacterium]
MAAAALPGPGGDGLATLELAIRTAMQSLGGSLLEELLALDGGHRGPRVKDEAGHEASFVGYRDKHLDTVLGPVSLRRAYYHCSKCGSGVVPKDAELGVVRSSMSPGLRAMVAKVAAAGPFARAKELLSTLAGVELTTKAVERRSEADGKALQESISAEAKSMAAGAVVPIGPSVRVGRLYVEMDGTGVPTVAADTTGRTGKGPEGKAHTREVKIGVVFTQTKSDKKGHPVRDPGSSTWVATLDPVASFGSLIKAEAGRRGSARARQVIVLGDGAPWIWNLAGEQFPSGIQIVDLYHAREHLHDLGALVAGHLGEDAEAWLADRLDELDRGDVGSLAGAARNLELPETKAAEVERALAYFETNAHRMRYSHFRALGFFVGSGVVEAGCRAVVGQRLKLSGMRWSARGASAIVGLRCEEASGRWEEIWLRVNNQTGAA